MKRRTEILPADEAQIVDAICAEIDKVRDRMTTEASWRVLEQHFYEALLGHLVRYTDAADQARLARNAMMRTTNLIEHSKRSMDL